MHDSDSESLPTSILVRSGSGRPFRCEVSGPGACRYCAAPIMWATTANGKAIPLEPFSARARYTDAHFSHCRRAQPEPSHLAAIELTERRWRHLLLLVQPEKHHGGATEPLANDVTLLEQRVRVTREG